MCATFVSAGLSKPALLSVFTSLLSSHPSLKPVVLALLPAPSFDSFSATLQAMERRVLEALPVGGNILRQEYVYTRIRAPLEEYVAELRLALGQFCPVGGGGVLAGQVHGHTTTTITTAGPTSHGQGQDDPATVFAFLYILTLSVRKLEAVLPRAPLPFSSSSSAVQASITNPSTLNHRDPLISLLPPLFNQWHTQITRLGALVNQHGRVLGAEMVRGWFRNLDALINPPLPLGIAANATNDDAASVGRRAAEAVRERFTRELGWLIGVRPQAQVQQAFGNGGSTGFGSAGQASALTNQMADSRMMDNGDDSDEEL